MRKMILAGAVMFAAAPALAQPPAYGEEWDEDAIEMPAPDPREIRAMAGMMDRLLGAVMDLPIGGIVAAVDPLGRGGHHPDARVRDFAGPHAEGQIRRGIDGSMRSMDAMGRALGRMMPTLQRSMRELERSIEQAIDEADRGR